MPTSACTPFTTSQPDRVYSGKAPLPMRQVVVVSIQTTLGSTLRRNKAGTRVLNPWTTGFLNKCIP